jgi:hypothetical protein
MKIHLLCEDAGLLVETQYAFHCPGCECGHAIRVKGPEPCWGWNGSLTIPTFTPSILVNAHDPASRCHSFVTDGKIQFLTDSYHALKGQTVEIPEWDD